MAALRLARFKVDPADTTEMVARRNALVAAAKETFPGLTGAQLAQVDDKTWIDVWRWDSRTNAQEAIANGSAIPEAAAAFSLVKDITMELAEVVDER
jgi:hypothetical protein